MHNDFRQTDRPTNRPTDICLYRAPMELKIGNLKSADFQNLTLLSLLKKELTSQTLIKDKSCFEKDSFLPHPLGLAKQKAIKIDQF